MSLRIPSLIVNGADGKDLVPGWGKKILGARIVTRLSDESDECTFMFSNAPPFVEAPAENTPFDVRVGWRTGNETDKYLIGGTYYFERLRLIGDPKTGEQMHLICRSGQTADLNNVNSRHFDKTNGHHTVGDLFRSVFAYTGRTVEVAPSIDNLPIPGGYALQWNQSDIHFAQDIAQDLNAVIKPMGGKIIIMDKDAGQSVSGQDLGTLYVDRSTSYRYEGEFKPRFQYQSVSVNFFDADQGRLKVTADQQDGATGAKGGDPHVAASEDAAKLIAHAKSCEYRRFSGTASFDIPGDPNAVAGVPVKANGYPDPIDKTKWIAEEVTHEVVPENGWITTVEVATDAS